MEREFTWPWQWRTNHGLKAEEVQGVKVRGDALARPTRWWNRWWLVRHGWEKVAILEAPEDTIWRVGFKDTRGRVVLLEKRLTRSIIAMQVGHEDVTFFGVSDEGREIPVKVREVGPRGNARWSMYPLY